MTEASTTSSNASSPSFGVVWRVAFSISLRQMVAFYLQSGLKPMTVLQSVASGLLGRASFQGGTKVGRLGSIFYTFSSHFRGQAIYYVASRRLTFMVERPVIAGLIYGGICMDHHDVCGASTFGDPQVADLEYGINHYGPIGHMFLGGAADCVGS